MDWRHSDSRRRLRSRGSSRPTRGSTNNHRNNTQAGKGSRLGSSPSSHSHADSPQVMLLLLWISTLTLAAFYEFRSVREGAGLGVEAWKREEFPRCDQTSFCKDARERPIRSSAYHVSGAVNVTNGRARARLVSSAPLEHEGALILHVISYEDATVRFKVKEEHIASGREKRFEVPDVLVDDADQKKLWIQDVKELDGVTWILLDGLEVALVHHPFQIFVKRGDDTLLSLNSKGLFHFEQRQPKHEEDDWDVTFRSHTDTRPNGPQSVSFDVSFHGADHVYGIPEHATSLALRPTNGPGISSEPYRLFNLDVFEYLAESPFGLYGSVPLMFSHGQDRTTGFFWLNSAEILVDVMASDWDLEGPPGGVASSGDKVTTTQWTAESGILDVFVFAGPEPKDVIRQYTSLTGTSAMPQLFATAYHQCRWNYKDEADVAAVDAGFDEHDIPYDVLWLDIEHTEEKKYFTWDRTLFPNPKEMQDKLGAKGRHMVAIVDPHIKRDNGFPLHKEATSKGYYVKDKHRRDFEGWCWPGSSSYVDMLNPEIRSWWADKFSYANYVGSTPNLYIWNDMNEPSVFNGPEVSMPRDCIHFGDVEHRDVHNAYGLYFHMASTEGLLKRGGYNDRPFVLSRAFFAGSQRIGAIWTGDNTASWDQLKVSIPMMLSIGLTGIAFAGADVGGFFGNPDAELFTRWYQLGAYYPFFRGHAHLDTKRREPWLFGEPYTSYVREAIHTRYALLPYVYTLFKEASETGVPLMRPLWLEYPKDQRTFATDTEFLFGSDLFVHGIFDSVSSQSDTSLSQMSEHLEEGPVKDSTSQEIYFPGSQAWYDVRTGARYSGGQTATVRITMETIPVFQRAGSIIPRKDRFRRSSTQMEFDPYTLVVALNSSYEAGGKLYIDDGKSYNYRNGAFIFREFSFRDGRLFSTSAVSSTRGTKSGGAFQSPCFVERIILLGLKPNEVSAAHRVLIESVGSHTSAERGPSLLRKGVSANALVIRLPKLPIGEDWSVKVL